MGPDGKFNAVASDYQGRWVKDADRDIVRKLRAEGALLHQEQYLHDYPFCCACRRGSAHSIPAEELVHPHDAVQGQDARQQPADRLAPGAYPRRPFRELPGNECRLGPSRERFWGTPLPIWVCEETGYMEAVASYDEFLAKPGVEGVQVWENAKRAKPALAEHLKVHKPYIDAITYESPRAPGNACAAFPR